jgi:hypothetical protein
MRLSCRQFSSGFETKEAPLENLEKTLKIKPTDLSALFSAAMMTVPTLGEGGDVGEFIAAVEKYGIISRDTLTKVQPFLDSIVSQRSIIGQSIRRAALPAQVLPYITNVEIVVDLRMAFLDNAVQDVVPVAMVHIDTDAQAQEIWFQASKSQMLQLRNDVDEAIKRMEAADAWGQKEKKA